MVTAAYYILKEETTYHELGSDCFERRSRVHLTRLSWGDSRNWVYP
jgi:hypothetical protein